MELREYWRVIVKHWWLILAIPIVSAAISGYYSMKIVTPTYEATASVLLNDGTNSGPDSSTVQGVITGQTFDNAVIEQHPYLGLTSFELSKILSVNITGQILDISATAPSQAQAATAANAAAQTFIQSGSNLMGMPSARWNNHAPSSDIPPVSPHTKKNALMAFVLGLLVSLGLTFMLEYLDMRIKTEADMIRFLQIPALGSVQDYHSTVKKRQSKRSKAG